MIYTRRGPQKPKRSLEGINHFALIRYFEDAKNLCEKYEDKDTAVVMENLVSFFRNYDSSKPLKFDSRHIGF